MKGSRRKREKGNTSIKNRQMRRRKSRKGEAQVEEEHDKKRDVHEKEVGSYLVSFFFVEDLERWVQQDIEIVHHGVLVRLWK